MNNSAQKQEVQNTTITTAIITNQNPTDSHLLHRQFVQLGRERNKITYKLLALLPKIYQAKIYETEGYATIYEYAGKLAGLSHSVVEKALKLENELQNKPHLQKAIETQGIHKVALVAKLATPQTDSFFADKVENMSKPALQQWSKEIRMEAQNWPQEMIGEKSKMKIELDNEMEFLFLKLKNKLGKNLSNKEALRRMLTALDQKNTKSPFTSKNPRGKFDTKIKNITKYQTDHVTRYICVITKRAALEITNGKCAHEGCNRPYEILHHVVRFAAGRSHESIIPLCKEHHEFAHNGLLKEDGCGGSDSEMANVDGRASGVEDTGKAQIDYLYRKYRQAAIA